MNELCAHRPYLKHTKRPDNEKAECSHAPCYDPNKIDDEFAPSIPIDINSTQSISPTSRLLLYSEVLFPQTFDNKRLAFDTLVDVLDVICSSLEVARCIVAL